MTNSFKVSYKDNRPKEKFNKTNRGLKCTIDWCAINIAEVYAIPIKYGLLCVNIAVAHIRRTPMNSKSSGIISFSFYKDNET